MKQLLTLVTFLFLSTSPGITQSLRTTILKIRISDYSPIQVNLDGRFIDKGTTTLTLDGLRPGLHRLEVYSDAGRRRPVRVYTGTLRLRSGTVNVGVVDVVKRGLHLRIRAMDDRDLEFQGNNGGGVREPEATIRTQEGYDRSSNDHRDDDIYGSSKSGDSDSKEGYGFFPRGRDSQVGLPGNTVSRNELDKLESRTAALITDSEKVGVLQSFLQNRTIYTAQVRQILTWLSFESTRLDFAKWAYSKTLDPEDYQELEEEFDLRSSRSEFRKYVNSR